MSAISGMTGFGRADGAQDGWSWSVEARSVNGRTLDVRFRGPPGFDGLERLARAAAQARLGRGQVTLGLQARRVETGTPTVRVNQSVLDHYLALANSLTEQGAAPPAADGLLALRGVLEIPEEVEDPEARAAVEAAMAVTIEAALDALKVSREREGAQLLPVLTGFVDRIAALVAEATTGAGDQTTAVRERFARRMTDLAPDAPAWPTASCWRPPPWRPGPTCARSWTG